MEKEAIKRMFRAAARNAITLGHAHDAAYTTGRSAIGAHHILDCDCTSPEYIEMCDHASRIARTVMAPGDPLRQCIL